MLKGYLVLKLIVDSRFFKLFLNEKINLWVFSLNAKNHGFQLLQNFPKTHVS